MRPRDLITLFGAWLWPLVAYRQSDRMQWIRVLLGLDCTISSRCSAVHKVEPSLKGGPPCDPGRSKDTHIVDLKKRVEVLSRELGEALEQQAATSEVLRVISSSPGELDLVFQTMLANAIRICDANFGALFRFEDGVAAAAAMLGVPPAFAEFWQRGPYRPGSRTALGRVMQTLQTVHIADVTVDPAYLEGEPIFVAAVELGGFRTILNVPILKEDELIGVFAIYRQEVRSFSGRSIWSPTLRRKP